MEKPTTLSVKNFLIRKLAVDMIIPESTIQAVINHQFSSAFGATMNYKSIEVSGFGKFTFNETRAVKRMEKYTNQKKMYEDILEDNTISLIKRRNTELRLNTTLGNISCLKPRINED